MSCERVDALFRAHVYQFAVIPGVNTFQTDVCLFLGNGGLNNAVECICVCVCLHLRCV